MKYLMFLMLFASSLAMADGNGNAGSKSSAGGYGVFGVTNLGYFDGWQTANPNRIKYLMSLQPKQAQMDAVPASWPTWVQGVFRAPEAVKPVYASVKAEPVTWPAWVHITQPMQEIVAGQ